MSIPPPPLPPATDLPLPPPPTAVVPAIPRNPFTPTVLLTHAPPFLHTFRAVRDWLFPCGNVRHCTFFPRKKDDDDDDNNASMDKDSRITVLITMSHPDGACQFLAAFKAFSSRLDDRYNTMQAYMVPANKDVPLPPPILDPETQERLGGQLWDNFVRAEAPELQEGGATGDASGTSNNADAATAAGTSAPAATTAMGDEDEDPLSNPAVVAAVKEFRRKLSKTHSYQNKKRMDLVAQKMAEIKPKVAAQMEQEKQMAAAAAAAPPPPLPPGGALPPPPPPMGSMPPPPEGLPPPPAPVATAEDSGKRGLSNLPAWMTEGAGGGAAAAPSDEPPTKRVKQEPPPSPANANAASFPPTFPPLPPSSHDPLRTFLADKVQEHLGEQEATLIQFLHSHILAQKSTDELLQELQMVLDDEAPVFLQEIWGKIHELVLLK